MMMMIVVVLINMMMKTMIKHIVQIIIIARTSRVMMEMEEGMVKIAIESFILRMRSRGSAYGTSWTLPY